MSAGSGPTVTFGADLSELHASYARFVAYVRANPPSVTGVGLEREINRTYAMAEMARQWRTGGIGAQAMGESARNAAKEFVGETERESSRRGGFLSGRGGGRGPLERLLTASVLAHGALRAGQGYAEYLTETGGSATERLQAEKRLQERLFSIPYLGQAAELATLPFRAGTEATAHQAQLGAQQAELMQKQLDMTRHAMQRASEYGAGPPGSYEFQRLQFQHEAERENIQARRFETERAEHAAKTREDIQAEQRQWGEREKAKAFLSGVLPGSPEWEALQSRIDTQVRGAGSNADAMQAQAKRDRERIEQLNEQVRQAREAELDYQRQQTTLRAGEGADIARLEYERKPQVAEARGIFNQGRREAEAFRHAGNLDAASSAIEESRYRLLAMRDELLRGGTAEAIDSARSLDLSGTDTSLRGRLGSDDTDAALREIREELKKNNELMQKMSDKL